MTKQTAHTTSTTHLVKLHDAVHGLQQERQAPVRSHGDFLLGADGVLQQCGKALLQVHLEVAVHETKKTGTW